MKRITSLLLIMMLLTSLVPLTQAQDEIIGTTSGELNVRSGAGTNHGVLGILSLQAEVIVENRNQVGDWLLVRTPDGSLRGWVASRFIYLPVGVNVQAINPIAENPVAAAAPPAENPAEGEAAAPVIDQGLPPGGSYAIPDVAANGDIGTMVSLLENTPILHNMGTGEIRSIYARGQALENPKRGNVFTRVGDSITAAQPFLKGFGDNNYDLGEYGHLQSTIDFFNATPPRDGYINSWNYDSLSAQSAFNAGAVLDRLWTNGNLCQPATEAPLQCEYRLTRPAIAIIMLGSVDVQIYDLQRYTDFMNRIVELSINEGVIPVLNTFPISESYLYYEQSLRFNMVILDIANSRGLPVINLWQATRPLPDRGMRADLYHLSQGPTFYRLDGSENQWGVTLRNLLTLQALHELRGNIPL